MHSFSKDTLFDLVKRLNWRLSLSLLIISIILWLYSLVTTSVNNITDFGIITALPVPYFISIIFLSLSFFISLFYTVNRKMLFLQIFLLIVFLCLTPVLVEGARLHQSYGSYALSNYIIHSGFADPTVASYNSWPSFQIFTAIFVLITGVDPTVLIPLGSPFLMNLLMLLPLYFFFKTVLSDDLKVWLSLWIFYFVNWGSRDFLSSQTFSYILFILMFTLMFFFVNKSSKPLNNTGSTGAGRSSFVMVILFFMAVVSGHLLSGIICLAVLCVLYFTKFFNRKFLLLSLIALIVCWTVYAARVYLQQNLARLIAEMLDFITNVFSNVNKYGSVDQAWGRTLTNHIKMGYAVIILLFAFIGLINAYKRKSLVRTDKIMLLSMIGIWLLLPIPYGGELFTRLWLFSLPFIVFFIVKIVDNRKIFAIFIIFLLLFSPALFTWSKYGEEAFDYIPPSEISGSKFLRSTTTPGCAIIGDDYWTEGVVSYHFSIVHINFVACKYNFTSTVVFARFLLIAGGNNNPLCIVFTHSMREGQRRLYSEPELFDDFGVELTNSTLFNKVYSNPDFVMYETSTQPRMSN